MNLIRKVNTIPLTTFLLFSLVIGFIFLIPLSILLVQQQTKLPSSAAPNPTPIRPIKTYGPIPSQPPQIDKLIPFVGKSGDVILIQGKNLGNNPKESRIIFPGVAASPTDILRWKDKEIAVRIPAAARSGLVRVIIGPWQVSWSIPLTIYNYKTKLHLKYSPPVLKLEGVGLKRVEDVYIWLDKGNKIATSAAFLSQTKLHHLPLAVALIDKEGRIIPFYVSPAEFGF